MRFPAIKTFMVPMRDGVRLATDVRYGRGKGPWPVLLLRTPYGRRQGAVGDVHPNYAMVNQDVRGRFDSEGRARPFFDDAWGSRQDGFDTIQWILAQPWCNGRIGSLGGSALGMTQQMLAGASPPGLLAQHIWVAGASIYHHFAYYGGMFQENLFGGWIEKAQWPAAALRRVLRHPFYDKLWAKVDSVARIPAQDIDLPAVHCGGWWDMFPQATIDAFVSRSKVSPNQWLIIGPWPHGVQREVGEMVFPPNALKVPKPGHDVELWFDYWLRGRDNGMSRIPRVQYYVMGASGERGAPGNRWRRASAWPVPALETALHLAPGGRLVRRPPPRGHRLCFRYDPADPVPTHGGRNMFIPAGPMDQRELEKRADVLVFSTAPLKQPVEVTGRVRARLYASSSARDTAFTAKLCDVYPDGRSMVLTDGILRAACRRSLADPSPLEPGRAYCFDIDLGSISIIFNRGHRIRLDISSSNSPRFAAHPNVWDRGAPRAAQQTVYCGGAHPSAVILPVVTDVSR